MVDPHAELAKALFGEVTPENRARAKEINYLRAYSCGEIRIGRKAGQYPVPDLTPEQEALVRETLRERQEQSFMEAIYGKAPNRS